MVKKEKKDKKGTKSGRKLSVRKETVKDLGARPGTARELDDDQLDQVNGGAFRQTFPTREGKRGKNPDGGTGADLPGQVFTVACQTLACPPGK